MHTNHLGNLDIELSDIWEYELEIIHRELKFAKRQKYSREEFIHMKVFYHSTRRICLKYGTSFLIKKGDDDSKYIEYQKEYKSKKTLKEKIEHGFFDFKEAMYCLNQNIIIPKEDEVFDYWFALKLSQFDTAIKYIDQFLDYQLNGTFMNDHKGYYNFLTLTCRQYEDSLLTNRVLETVYEYVDFLSEEIDALQSQNKKQKTNAYLEEDQSSSGYILIGSKKDPHFFQKQNKKFLEVFHTLKDQKLIHNDTSYTHFKSLFSANLTQEYQPIHWTGLNAELKAFIVTLRDQYKIEEPKSGIWKLTIKLFIDRRKRKFHYRNLGNSVPNEDTKRKIRKIVAKLP